MAHRASLTSSKESLIYYSRSKERSDETPDEKGTSSVALNVLSSSIYAIQTESATNRRRSNTVCADPAEENFASDTAKGGMRTRTKTDISKLVEHKLGTKNSAEQRKDKSLLRRLSLTSIEPVEESEKSNELLLSHICTPRPRQPAASRTKKTETPSRKKHFRKHKSPHYFPYKITCPALTQAEWERNAARKLEEFTKEKETLNPNNLLASFRMIALNTTTIIKRIEEAQGRDPLPFLAPFAAIRDPKVFLKALRKLPKNQRRTLIEIIGGESALTLLRLCKDKKVHKGWKLHLERLRLLKEASEECEAKIFRFDPDFDKEYPIASVQFNDVRDSFRTFFGSQSDTSEVFFQINDKSLTIPEIDQTSDGQRKIDFMEWLIGELSVFLPTPSTLDVKEQARLLCEGTLKTEDKNFLIHKLKTFFTKYQKADITTLLERIEKEDFPPEFAAWAREHIVNCLCHEYRSWVRKHKADNLNVSSSGSKKTLSKEVVEKFEKAQNLEVLKRAIPCYGILQSLSFSAYATPSIYIRTLFPTLFSKIKDQPQMKSFPVDPTRYEISIDSETGQYEATQVKLYRFYYPGDTEAANILLGKVDVLWTVCGNIESEKRMARLSFRNLDLDPRVNMESRLQVIKGLGLLND